jgi:hypothetical protein
VIGRRLAALAGVLGLALAALVLPAAAQTPPPTIDNFSPRCSALNGGPLVDVNGRSSARSVSMVLYAPSGSAVTKAAATPSSGFYSFSFEFNASQAGSYEVRISDSGGSVSAYIEVPCQNPTLEYDPPCFPVGYDGAVTMTARHFVPYAAGYMTYDVNGSETQSLIRIPVDGRGVFSATFKVRPSNRPHPGEGTDANRGLVARATWAACPPGATTTAPTTTTSTTAPPADDVPIPTTTTRPTVPGSIPTTTLPPTIEIPPPTPGATLVVTPPLGPTGFVTGAVGTGFPPGPVELTWSGGIGTTMTIAGPDGTFSTRVLVLPGDRLGPRALVATGGGTSTFAAFLVVPSTVQPSGDRVAQINRIRRFNNR